MQQAILDSLEQPAGQDLPVIGAIQEKTVYRAVRVDPDLTVTKAHQGPRVGKALQVRLETRGSRASQVPLEAPDRRVRLERLDFQVLRERQVQQVRQV